MDQFHSLLKMLCEIVTHSNLFLKFYTELVYFN